MSSVQALPSTSKPSDLVDRIHYACGKTIFPGWLNADSFDEYFPNNESTKINRLIRMNITEAHPFPDRYFRFGYAEGLLERLTQAQSLLFLSECFRTFAEGGVLRLAFRGLRGIVQRHFRGTTYHDAVTGCREAFEDFGFEHFYCEQSIELAARQIGFSRVQICQVGVSQHAELRDRETLTIPADLIVIAELTK